LFGGSVVTSFSRVRMS